MEQLPLTLTITTPEETRSVRCDAVSFKVPNGENSPNAGGSIGIRRGHTDALMAVDEGRIVARAADNTVLIAEITCGFAVIRQNTVTVITDHITPVA